MILEPQVQNFFIFKHCEIMKYEIWSISDETGILKIYSNIFDI